MTQDRIEEREAEAVRTALDALREQVEVELEQFVGGGPRHWVPLAAVLRLIDEARPGYTIEPPLAPAPGDHVLGLPGGPHVLDDDLNAVPDPKWPDGYPLIDKENP